MILKLRPKINLSVLKHKLIIGQYFNYKRDVEEYTHCNGIMNVGHAVPELGEKIIPDI